jgi:nucleotide-binding universal stress UspA family protein
VDERTRCFVVCTDETGRYDASVAKALDRAAGEGAKVILYDVSAPGSAFSDPRPNAWAGEGEREVYDHPLDPVALEKLGRHLLARQVQQARARGVDAYGWLPDKPGGDTLTAYAAQQQADLVILPEDLAQQDLADYFAPGRATPGLTVERV